ncbi:unnamed protein product [Moneuplotes crassus]|uniref:EF-hand domain-containing protein n=1 Tax=Euplotes crassus TaxID=5936 RepID=A0AAD2D778_EUPCR|nr:unnamed protein product [Moneuplotes crassus]
MGNKSLEAQEVAELSKETKFTSKEVKRIHKRFGQLDVHGRGYITIHDLATLPDVDKNPLGDRICRVLAEEGKNSISFKEFIKALAVFNDKDNDEEKLKFLFKVYDIDGDGYVTKDELFVILKSLVGNSLNNSQLEQISEKTISDTSDGKMGFEEFKKIFSSKSTF